MKLSIFPECKAHPTKAEKRAEAFKFSAPYLPQTVEVTDDEELIKYVTEYAWSPAVFDGVRKAENFVSCDFLVYDVDEGMTIDEADAAMSASGFCYLVLPSPSHTPEAHRFRIIVPLSHSILDLETFEATWKDGAKFLKTVDEQCSDCCRAYFGSTTIDGFADFSGELLSPLKKAPVEEQNRGYKKSQVLLDVTADIADIVTEIYGMERAKVPEAVDYFIRNAHTGIHGGWVNALNAACFSLSLSGVEEDSIMLMYESLAPDNNDPKDLYQIKRAIKDGIKARL